MTEWRLDFSTGSGIAGLVRLELGPTRLELGPARPLASYWAYLAGVPGVPGFVVVRDDELPRPRQGLELRGEGLWAELVCETPGEHWTFGLEAFGLRVDTASDARRAAIGDRLPVGLDLEWEVATTGPPDGTVHGDVLVGRDRVTVDGSGRFAEGADVPPAAELLEAWLARVQGSPDGPRSP